MFLECSRRDITSDALLTSLLKLQNVRHDEMLTTYRQPRIYDQRVRNGFQKHCAIV